MPDILLSISSPDGSQEMSLPDGKVSFGRGSDADVRLDDDGLSRLHATVFREGEKLWVLDENSTNGTSVNGEPTSPRGTILREGDVIKIGNSTRISVAFRRAQPTAAASSSPTVSSPSSKPKEDHTALLVPILVTMIALFVIAGAGLFIGIKMFRSGDNGVTYSEGDEDDSPSKRKAKDETKTSESPSPNATPGDTTIVNAGSEPQLPSGKFQDMSETDKDRYIAIRAEKIARIIGNQKSDPIPAEAVKTIKEYVNGYVKRLKNPKKDSCEQGWYGSDFLSVLTRATRTSPMITRQFRTEGIEPQIGIYIAMIEGEHCPCLTSPTGAQGLFQFLASSAPDYGLDPSRRCEPEESAKAGAKYLKSLIGRYGTAPDSVPLAIASFNSGQGNLSQNLDKVLAQAAGQNRSFWTLVANRNILQGRAGEQFNNENIKYVPKFFAAAIVGEHPSDFGITLQPLSTYTQ